MASDKAYLEFVLEQLSGLDGITYRPMMGEFLLYYQGILFGGIYDDRFLVKRTPAAERLMPDAPQEIPYEGAKAMLTVEELENPAFLCELIPAIAEELPPPKPRRAKR